MKNRFASLASRLTPVFAGDGIAAIISRRLFAVVLLFAALDVTFVLVTYARDKEGLGQHLLSLQSEEIAEAVTADDAGLHFRPERLHRERIGNAALAFAVYDRQGHEVALEGPWDLAHALMPPITSVDSETRRDDHAWGFVLRGVRRTAVGGQPIWIVMTVQGKGLRPFWPVIANEMIQHVGLPLLPLVLLLLALNLTVVRRTLAPLTSAAREVEALKPDHIEARLTVPSSPGEVRRLVHAFNAALDRIQSAIAALKDFTADAAHELRTPLAILSMQADTLPPGTAKEKLRDDIAAMTRLVGQMLDMASADTLTHAGGAAVDLAVLGADVVARLTPLALASARNLRFADERPQMVKGHAEAISRALRNLIENALRYTPQAGVVEVTAGPGPVLSVRDQGPGIPADKRALVLKRFWRGDRSRSDSSGLGLAIASRIAEAHGGCLEIDDAEGGGAVVRLWLGPAGAVQSSR